MKIIIAGSREFTDYELLKQIIIDSELEITEVVSGGANGADKLGEQWAKENDIPIKQFIPNWKDISVPGARIKENSYGKYNALAGFDRNQKMAEYADALIATNEDTNGSADMVKRMRALDKTTYVHTDMDNLNDVPF